MGARAAIMPARFFSPLSTTQLWMLFFVPHNDVAEFRTSQGLLKIRPQETSHNSQNGHKNLSIFLKKLA